MPTGNQIPEMKSVTRSPSAPVTRRQSQIADHRTLHTFKNGGNTATLRKQKNATAKTKSLGIEKSFRNKKILGVSNQDPIFL